MTAAKRGGRPAGLLLNPYAANQLLADRPRSWLANTADVTQPVLSELMAGQRGASKATADKIAAALGCHPAAIFPELAGFETAVRVFKASGVEP